MTRSTWIALTSIAVSASCIQTPSTTGTFSSGSGLNDETSSDQDDDDDNSADDDDDDDDSAEATSSTPGTSAGDDDDDNPTTIVAPRLDVGSVTTLEGGVTTETCADADVVITPGEATITLLIDRSGSMVYSFGSTGLQRWDAVNEALFGTNSIISAYQDEVQFGLALYTNDNEETNGCPDLDQVAPAFGNYAAMQTVFQAAVFDAKLETPTAESLRDTAASLIALNDGTSKAILLVTDGEPDSCAFPDGDVVPRRGEVIHEADTIFNDLGIPIFVIAIVGDELNDTSYEHLQDLANVGIGAVRYYEDPALTLNPSLEDWVDTRTPATPGTLYTVENVDELGAAFGTLISSFVPCDFTLNGEVKLDQQCRGSVTLDGQVLECGVDWEVSSPSTLTLLPPACAILQNGQNHDVSADFPCEVFVVG